MSEQIEEIFAYYGKQRDKSSQEMVIALLRAPAPTSSPAASCM